MKTVALVPALALLLSACERPPAASAAAPATPPVASRVYARQDWPLPSAAIAAQPDLVATPDGHVLLAWIEPQAGGHALRFARTDARGAWQPSQTIAIGTTWFVNWADTPHIAATADGALWAHWLQKSAAATYAYDVALVRSSDGGSSWSPPLLVNDDGTATEHGFVSLWPASRDTLGIAWLDGRNTQDEGSAGGASHARHADQDGHAGAMSLRTATFDAGLERGGERELDAMTCDCCQTDAALTARGPLLVYRGRTPDEIRDIVAQRLDGAAAPGRIVHADRWKMPACPVNGPAVAARGEEAVVAWYTAANDVPTLKIARSADAGATFAAPLVLDQGAQVQGRVDVALSADAAWLLWMREDANGQSVQLARYAPDLSRELQRVEVAKLQGRGRATGFPQLALSGDGAYVVWTDVVDGKPGLRGARYAASP
ncbi:hypothetical protein ACFQZQ_10035 [Lysobacter koreensis]|uniref:Exo-alpha-sialidase n=1 Tax=Lysobacter koreensis TaxID=266122 RepID=A0ABW2YML1_9GAMM